MIVKAICNTDVPVIDITEYQNLNHSYSKRGTSNDHEMLKEEYIEDILETKDNEFNELKKRLAL